MSRRLSSPESTRHRQVEITSAAQLRAALASTDVALRTATLQAIIARPEQAAAKAAGYGCDLFAELQRLHDGAATAVARDSYAGALRYELERCGCLFLLSECSG